jgi:hypothetical protein
MDLTGSAESASLQKGPASLYNVFVVLRAQWKHNLR